MVKLVPLHSLNVAMEIGFQRRVMLLFPSESLAGGCRCPPPHEPAQRWREKATSPRPSPPEAEREKNQFADGSWVQSATFYSGNSHPGLMGGAPSACQSVSQSIVGRLRD